MSDTPIYDALAKLSPAEISSHTRRLSKAAYQVIVAAAFRESGQVALKALREIADNPKASPRDRDGAKKLLKRLAP